MIWLIFSLLTCTALLFVLHPLAFHSRDRASLASRKTTYEQFLAEIDAERSAGLLDQECATELRIEVARRYLDQDERDEPRATSESLRTIAALAAIVLIPMLSLPLYLHLGHHDMADQPLAARIATLPGHKDSAKKITELEAFLHRHPNDGRIYELIAPFYLREHRGQDAVHALQEAVRLLGPSVDRVTALGEARFFAADGVVTKEAQSDFETGLQLESGNIVARYYLGLAAFQRHDSAKARDIWSRLLIDMPEGSRWRERLMQQLGQLGNAHNGFEKNSERVGAF